MFIVPVPDEDHSSKNIKVLYYYQLLVRYHAHTCSQMVLEIGNHIDATVKKQFAQHEQKKWIR